MKIYFQYITSMSKKDSNSYKEGLDLKLFDDRSGMLITYGSTAWTWGGV